MTTHLYNCKVDGDHYRITKFDIDLNPIEGSSYLTSLEECDCPAGHRSTCRHRQMLPQFINHRSTNGQAFLNFEKGSWTQASIEDELDDSCAEGVVVNEDSSTLGDLEIAETAARLGTTGPASWDNAPLGPGINLLDLAGDPAEPYNAIADAIGGPRINFQDKNDLHALRYQDGEAKIIHESNPAPPMPSTFKRRV